MSQKIPGVEEIKTAFDGTTGYGAEMLPTEVSEEIIMQVWEESWVRNTFQSVNMTTETLKIPKFTAGITMQGTTGYVGTAATESRQSTDEVELSMKTIIGNAPIDRKTLAYAVPTLMPAIEGDIKDSVAETEEDVFVNGDTTAGASNINGAYNITNFPDGIVTRDPRLELKGLRYYALNGGASVNASGASLTSTHVRKALAALGKYGKKKTDLVMIVSTSVETVILGWDELKTLDKYGPQATVLTGEIGKLFGMTVIGTSLIPDTLDSTGVARNQGSGTTADNRTVVLVVNKRSPIIGNPTMAERKFTIEIDDEPTKDQIILVPKEDMAFNVRYLAAICQIINVLPGTL
ncbi:phage major capsid protein [Sulfuricurvum sp.]|uniref:phage major capsid protein n=1 Tax=Sulfuricurvum sp. TaxID=2025608 RepID=UPI003565BD6A